MDHKQLGSLIAALGAAAVAVGAAVYSGWLRFLGRLPGDIRIEGDNYRIYIPLASMVLISLLLTLVVNLARKFFW